MRKGSEALLSQRPDKAVSSPHQGAQSYSVTLDNQIRSKIIDRRASASNVEDVNWSWHSNGIERSAHIVPPIYDQFSSFHSILNF